MKLPAMSLVSLPIAATIGAVCFSLNAQAQTPNNVPIGPQSTLEQCNSTASKNQNFQIIICNITNQPLRLVGVYNQIAQWPMRDVPAITAQHVDFRPGGAGFFVYSANYAIGDTGRFFQVGVSKPPAGREKINVCVEQSAGNNAAENCFDNMSSDQEKFVKTRGESIRGVKQNMEGKTQWVFFVR